MTETPENTAKPRHGTVRRYKDGCACEKCRAANTAARQRERDRARAKAGKSVPTRRKSVPTKGATNPQDDRGPIEAATRVALADAGGVDAIAVMRREVAYRAAAVMDNPKAAPFFKSAADVWRLTVADLIAAQPPKDGEADGLKQLMDSFGPRGRSRGSAPVDDTEAPE